ncbi:MAG TPA: glycosyltransferase, partial [Alphaproteobacteria bacterium]|nr:glycosyltransferase [Alphaproteobacteria bacterium]
ENQDYLSKRFSPKTENILAAKTENKLSFQEKMGLNKDEDAILLYWPSRINSSQKGIDSLIGCALDVLHNNKDVQIALVGEAQNGDSKYIDIIQDLIKNAPPGSISHSKFDKKLSNLGYASSSAIIGASKYEPFGLFWLQGVCAGAFGIGAENGGAVDILREFENDGNGFLYRNTDTAGLKYGIEKAITSIRQLKNNPEAYNKQMSKMMSQARSDFSESKMVENYLHVYNEAIARHDLFSHGYMPLVSMS